MNKYGFFGFITIILLTIGKANAEASITWREDGLITSTDGKQHQLYIQGIYDALNYEGSAYLAGFKIDEEGTNYPHVAKISGDLSSINYWSFEKIPNDIFVYQGKIQLVTKDGEIYKFEKNNWHLTSVRFPADSQIVYSDKKANLVVCHPESMEKTGDYNGGCFSTNNDWRLNFIWFTIVPKVCNGQLYIVEEYSESKIRKHIDLATGKILKSDSVKNLPEDICKL